MVGGYSGCVGMLGIGGRRNEGNGNGRVTGLTVVVIRSTFGKYVERCDFKTKEECDKYLANPHHSKS